jgi:hypothetical protein
MPGKKFTLSFLKDYCSKNNIILISSFTDSVIVLGSNFKIECKCTGDNCTTIFKKCFKYLIKKHGSLCCICTRRTSNQKNGNVCFDIELLNRTIDSALLIGEYNNISLNRESMITFKCSSANCECNDVKKNFRQLTISGPFCDSCTEKNRKQKVEETNIINFGVPNVFQSDQIIQQIQATNLRIYGDTCALRNLDVKQKSEETSMSRYNSRFPMQNPDIFSRSQKNSFRRKTFKCPSGKIFTCQGYETFALYDLIYKQKIAEDLILNEPSKMPEIWYLDVSNKKRRYYVDIFIPSQNKCIEVKSQYLMKKDYETIKAKQKAVKDAGYECEIWVYNNKGEKVECQP